MARKRVVSRTFKSMEVTIIGLDIVKAEPENRTFVIPYEVKDAEKILKLAHKELDSETYKVAAIVDVLTKDELRVQDEKFFYEHSEALPPRTKITEDGEIETTVAEEITSKKASKKNK